MPIQNVGTLLENLVVTEAACVLLEMCAERGSRLEFLNAFAMPPRSPWRGHPQNAGFADDVLDRVRDAVDSPAAGAYPRLLQANLLARRTEGPNAALLVLGVWGTAGRASRMWLNDIPNGHYGGAVPQLREIYEVAAALYGTDLIARDQIRIRVSDAAYPDSLADLSGALAEWAAEGVAGARLGFLDPMRYRIDRREGAETSSADHRNWLAQLAFQGPTIAVQFTGHSDQPSLERELCALHQDALSKEYRTSRCFKRQHYAVFVATHGPRSEAIAADLEERVQRAWESWCRTFTTLKQARLKTYRNGAPDEACG